MEEAGEGDSCWEGQTASPKLVVDLRFGGAASRRWVLQLWGRSVAVLVLLPREGDAGERGGCEDGGAGRRWLREKEYQKGRDCFAGLRKIKC